MSDTLFADLRPTICAKIKNHLPELRECEPHEGQYSLEDLKREGLLAPAVKVSCIAAKQTSTRSGGAPNYTLQMAAFVVTRDTTRPKMARDVSAANICQRLLGLIPENRWGLPACGEAQNVMMHSLRTVKVQSRGVSLWAVTWNQPMTFHVDSESPLGVELYVGRFPETGADHVEGYTSFAAGDEG
ncbi:hypothetical protein [Epibacterium ulvae]|uniref:hypothetical protein n=1 Tax=Epibacterium ulvae TaxID=1156985 RepID=UPI00249039B1|nr:hypothetical protein [Epibacterium ulvae]